MPPNPLPQLEQMTDILDLKDIQAWNLRWLSYSAVALLGLILFIILFGIYRRRRDKAQLKVSPKTPREIALQRLAELRSRGWIENGQARHFYFALSELWREFIESELGIPAAEATLEELRLKLKSFLGISSKQRHQALEQWELADMAKFAQFVPDRETMARSVQICQDWITELAEARAAAALAETEQVSSIDGGA